MKIFLLIGICLYVLPHPFLLAQNTGSVTHVLQPVSASSESVADSEENVEVDDEEMFFEWYQGARAYFKNKQYDEAQNVLETILEKQPYRTEAHLALAAVFSRQHSFEESLQELKFVMQNPDYREEGLRLQKEVNRVIAALGENL